MTAIDVTTPFRLDGRVGVVTGAPIDVFREVVDVNLNALLLLRQLAGRQMLERRWESTVPVASILGLVQRTCPMARTGEANELHGAAALPRHRRQQLRRRPGALRRQRLDRPLTAPVRSRRSGL